MLSHERKIELVEMCLRVRPERDPGVELLSGDGWVQTIHRTVESTLLNRVWLSVMEPGDADDRIASVMETYRAHGLPMMWMVSPSTRPHDLGARLLSRGFRIAGVAAGMIAPVEVIERGPSVALEPVTEENVDDWVHVQGVGWGMPPSARAAAREGALFRLARKGGRLPDFLYREGATACAACGVELHEGHGLLMNGIVLPEYRRRGICRGMIVAMASWLQRRGVPYATAHALRDTSASILTRMGFEEVCEIVGYSYP